MVLYQSFDLSVFWKKNRGKEENEMEMLDVSELL